MVHNERCKKCKETIKLLLEKIFGKVEVNYKFDAGANIEYYKNHLLYSNLNEIYENLQNRRGFNKFVKAHTLPNCDFFIPNPGFILEFDESQHFTPLRKIALQSYPQGLRLGFDKEKWIKLCEKINAKDNDPSYRDEQRAWYDTLRDVLPDLKGLKPTIRLFARDFYWCSLDKNNPSDIDKFESFLKVESNNLKFEMRQDNNPFLTRLVIAGKWEGNPQQAKKLIEQLYENWPKSNKVKFIVTCGGFIQFNWPESISRDDVRNNKFPNDQVVNLLVKKAEKCARFVLSDGLADKLKEITDYITLGIDSFKEKISTTQNCINQLHIELVLLVDLKNNKFYWTGKSYPTDNQQRGLVRISDLKTHFLELSDIGEVMILGCHDLNLLINRGKKTENESWKKSVRKSFQDLTKEKNLEYVLHHPHTTDSSRIWSAALGASKKLLPSLKIFASSGRYYNPKGERSKLSTILEKTKYGNTMDIIAYVD